MYAREYTNADGRLTEEGGKMILQTIRDLEGCKHFHSALEVQCTADWKSQ